MMNKNNYTISNADIDKIKKYIEQTNDTTSNLKDSNVFSFVISVTMPRCAINIFITF